MYKGTFFALRAQPPCAYAKTSAPSITTWFKQTSIFQNRTCFLGWCYTCFWWSEGQTIRSIYDGGFFNGREASAWYGQTVARVWWGLAPSFSESLGSPISNHTEFRSGYREDWPVHPIAARYGFRIETCWATPEQANMQKKACKVSFFPFFRKKISISKKMCIFAFEIFREIYAVNGLYFLSVSLCKVMCIK